jgi:hypothetical protein
MSNPVLIKSFPIAAALAGNLIVALSGTDNEAEGATANTDAIFGVSERMGAAAGGQLDVVLSGTYDVVAGGDVTAGDFITADANSKGIPAAPAAGNVVRYAGIALLDAVAGDLFPILVAPGAINTPAA